MQEYEFDESLLQDSSLKVLCFEGPTAGWAEFIYKNRSRRKPPFHHDYDIVIGPIADDGVAYLLDRYEEGSYTIEELARELKFKHLNTFKTHQMIMNQQQQQNFLIAYTIDRMTEFLIEDYELSIAAALQFIYNSETYQKLNQTDNGLYEQSPSYVYELLSQEYQTGVAA